MIKSTFAWSLIGAYVALAALLAYRGFRRTRSMEGFAVGNRDFSPVLVGLSLAVQLTSVATFVVNPGLVYAFGLPALLGMGVAASLGIAVGVTVLSKGFRRIGQQLSALSVPGWLGQRYGSRAMQIGFALLSLALVSFVVLILVAMSYVLMKMLGISAHAALVGMIVFIFGYVLIGGANTSVYTNTVQAMIMVVVALLLVGSGFSLLGDGPGALLDRVAAVDANLAGWVNPASPYFRNLFEVYICNFIVGLAIVCQPHVMGKALSLSSERDVNRYLGTAIAVGVIFALVLSVGLYARILLPGTTRIDLVVATYIDSQFSPVLGVLIGFGVLCAGISTLEGVLLAITAILASDLFFPTLRRRLAHRTPEAQGRAVLKLGRLCLLLVAAVAYLLSRHQMQNPTGGSVAIFAQYGVYCLFSASFAPMLFGMFYKRVGPRLAGGSALTALLVYLGMSFGEVTSLSNNPAVLSAFSIIASTLVIAAGLLVLRLRGPVADGSRPRVASAS